MILNSKVIITDLEVRVKCVLYGLTLLLDKGVLLFSHFYRVVGVL